MMWQRCIIPWSCHENTFHSTFRNLRYWPKNINVQKFVGMPNWAVFPINLWLTIISVCLHGLSCYPRFCVAVGGSRSGVSTGFRVQRSRERKELRSSQKEKNSCRVDNPKRRVPIRVDYGVWSVEFLSFGTFFILRRLVHSLAMRS